MISLLGVPDILNRKMLGKDGGGGIAGGSGVQYSEQLQNVHNAWLTGINPYDGYYGYELKDMDLVENGGPGTGTPDWKWEPKDDYSAEQESGIFGRIRHRIFGLRNGALYSGEFGDQDSEAIADPYPTVANAVKSRIGIPMDIVDVLDNETSNKNPYLSPLGTTPETYEINEGLLFDPDFESSVYSGSGEADATLWSNVQDRMPRYDTVLDSIKEFSGFAGQGAAGAYVNPIGETAKGILTEYFKYYLLGRVPTANAAPWVTVPAAATMPSATSSISTVASEFPDAPLGDSDHKDDTTLSGFPALALLDNASEITDVPDDLSDYDTDDLIEEHMAAKSTRSVEEMATTLARITAGMADIRAVMNTQFIGALTQIESSRMARLDEMETELKTRAMSTRLQHAATLSGEQRAYEQAKDQFTLANANWKVQRATQYASAERMLADSLDRWSQVKADWLLQRAVQKGAFDINLASANDQYTFNRVTAFMQGEAANLANTIQAHNAMLDTFLKFGEAERASFLQAYDLIRLRMGLELDTTMHNVEVVRRAFTWELEAFQYPFNYIASLGGAALSERAPNWGERMLASLSSAVSAGMNVGGMTGNPVLGGVAALTTLAGSALTGRG